jgi:hypothetical protein
MNLLPRKDQFPYVAAALLLAFVAWLYWPVLNAGFVWIDKLNFVDSAGLRQGDAWKHLVLHDFNNWTQYFRPLVVALFAIQLRLFDALPGPMHTVSLAMHLANMLMVGLLAKRVCGASERNSPWLGLLAMVLYGLHPLLIEPVAGDQSFDDGLPAGQYRHSTTVYTRSNRRNSFFSGCVRERISGINSSARAAF